MVQLHVYAGGTEFGVRGGVETCVRLVRSVSNISKWYLPLTIKVHIARKSPSVHGLTKAKYSILDKDTKNGETHNCLIIILPRQVGPANLFSTFHGRVYRLCAKLVLPSQRFCPSITAQDHERTRSNCPQNKHRNIAQYNDL